MLTAFYIDAVLVDTELADQIWEAWDKGAIDDQVALLAWWLLAIKYQHVETLTDEKLRQLGFDLDVHPALRKEN